jgi:hypothetical protein
LKATLGRFLRRTRALSNQISSYRRENKARFNPPNTELSNETPAPGSSMPPYRESNSSSPTSIPPNSTQTPMHAVKVGTLTCAVASGWDFVFGSSKDLRCVFRPNGHRAEHYVGSISKFGVDIGYTDGGDLIWGVFALTPDLRSDGLGGDYDTASASATVGAGSGSNVLVGGPDKSIALQPLSVEGNSGLNVAAGIGSISLKFVAADESN